MSRTLALNQAGSIAWLKEQDLLRVKDLWSKARKGIKISKETQNTAGLTAAMRCESVLPSTPDLVSRRWRCA